MIDISAGMNNLTGRWIINIHQKGGYLMFTVTEKALEVIQDFIKAKKPDAAVRITMSIG